MEFGEMKRNTCKWSNFCVLLSRAGLSASAGLSCSYCNWHYCSVVVYLSVTFVHYAQTADDISSVSFAYDSPVSLGTPSSPNFAPTWSSPCLFERRRHSMANCFPNGFSDSAVVTVESLWETTIAVLNGAIIDPSPFHQKLGFQMCPQDQLRDNQRFLYVRAM